MPMGCLKSERREEKEVVTRSDSVQERNALLLIHQEHESPTNAMSNMILAAPSAGPTTRQQSNKKRSLIKDTSKSKYVKKVRDRR